MKARLLKMKPTLLILTALLAPLAAMTAAVSGNLPAANPALFAAKNKPKQAARQKGDKPKTDPVRYALDKQLAAASLLWAAKHFAAVRAECDKVLAMNNAPLHYQSYAHLRIAQSYMAENNSTAARAEYEKIMANVAYPEVHRYEAEECVKEIE